VGDDPEDELAARQDPRLYPLGRALRSTFDADNHDSLDPVVTGLMLDLAHMEADRSAAPPASPSGPPPRTTLVDRMRGLFTRS